MVSTVRILGAPLALCGPAVTEYDGWTAFKINSWKSVPATLPFPGRGDTYPLFTSMVPPLEKQNQLLPHYLVTAREWNVFSSTKALQSLLDDEATASAVYAVYLSIVVNCRMKLKQ